MLSCAPPPALPSGHSAFVLCVGRPAVYELMLTSQLASIMIGRARCVSVAALEAFFAERLAETEGHA